MSRTNYEVIALLKRNLYHGRAEIERLQSSIKRLRWLCLILALALGAGVFL